MKTVFLCLLSLVFVATVFGQKTDPIAIGSKVATPDSTKKTRVVETACGECQFKLAGKGCHLAVKIDGKAYFVDGTDIDSHGDAHAKDGFCNAVRKAEVQGELVNSRYKVTYFKLVKDTEKKEATGVQKN